MQSLHEPVNVRMGSADPHAIGPVLRSGSRQVGARTGGEGVNNMIPGEPLTSTAYDFVFDYLLPTNLLQTKVPGPTLFVRP